MVRKITINFILLWQFKAEWTNILFCFCLLSMYLMSILYPLPNKLTLPYAYTPAMHPLSALFLNVCVSVCNVLSSRNYPPFFLWVFSLYHSQDFYLLLLSSQTMKIVLSWTCKWLFGEGILTEIKQRDKIHNTTFQVPSPIIYVALLYMVSFGES